jgi:hypothetical protein
MARASGEVSVASTTRIGGPGRSSPVSSMAVASRERSKPRTRSAAWASRAGATTTSSGGSAAPAAGAAAPSATAAARPTAARRASSMGLRRAGVTRAS